MAGKTPAVGDHLALRLSDGASWASEPWRATGPEGLRRGVERAWPLSAVSYTHPDWCARLVGMDPRLALRARLVEIESWLRERMSRAGASDEARRSWASQAVHWRQSARRILLGAERLQLQVRGPSGQWLAPGNGTPCPTVGRVVDRSRAADLFADCMRMAQHDAAISALSGWAASSALAED